MFKGRKLVIATKHGKEKVIAPILEKKLGVKCITPENIDTDIFGSFTGETLRQNDPITTARNKCLLAMKMTDCDLAVANEGSFGPHPHLLFVPADEELMVLIDKKNDIEITMVELSTQTNFNYGEIKTMKELNVFTRNAKFPDHGIIIRKTKSNNAEIIKDIKNRNKLTEVFNDFISRYGKAYLETDMRAMNNPTRMKVIKNTCIKLAKKANTLCPDCKTPGFGITKAIKGLPCKLCSFPTKSTLSYIFGCQKCTYFKEVKFPNNKTTEDPMYCDFCNP